MSSDGSTSAGSDAYCVMSVNASGVFEFYQFGTTTRLGLGTHNVCDGNWHWVELQMVLCAATAAGSATVHVDGNVELGVTGVKTVGSLYSPTGAVGVGSGGNNDSTPCANWFDDLIVWDTTGVRFNSFPLGQQRILTVNPSANGDLTQWTPSTGANYAVADQAYAGTNTLTVALTGETDLYQNSGIGQLCACHDQRRGD